MNDMYDVCVIAAFVLKLLTFSHRNFSVYVQGEGQNGREKSEFACSNVIVEIEE